MSILIGLMLSLILCLPAFANSTSGDQGIDTSSNNSVAKEETVKEESSITKDVEIGVDQTASAVQSAAASSTAAVDNSGNRITAIDIESAATIRASAFNDVEGIINLNQAPGSMNNQGNSVSVSFAKDDNNTFLHSGASLSQSSSGNRVSERNAIVSNTIKADAFNNVAGIVGINQSAGNANSQNNIACISIGGNPVTSLALADLGMISGNNTVIETGVSKTDTISSFAFERVSGIISINQSSGSMNNQVNVINISVHKFPF